MIGIAVVGYGYWGPNLVRNFWDVPDAQLIWVCDLETERLAGVRRRYPAVEITEDFDLVLHDRRVDAVAIATPVNTHYALAMRALRAGKSVFLEKPLASSAEQAERLIEEAERRGLVLARPPRRPRARRCRWMQRRHNRRPHAPPPQPSDRRRCRLCGCGRWF